MVSEVERADLFGHSFGRLIPSRLLCVEIYPPPPQQQFPMSRWWGGGEREEKEKGCPS